MMALAKSNAERLFGLAKFVKIEVCVCGHYLFCFLRATFCSPNYASYASL